MGFLSIRDPGSSYLVLPPCWAYAPKITSWPKMAAPTPATWSTVQSAGRRTSRGHISPSLRTLPRSSTHHFCSGVIGENLVTTPHRMSRDLGKCLETRQTCAQLQITVSLLISEEMGDQILRDNGFHLASPLPILCYSPDFPGTSSGTGPDPQGGSPASYS